MDSCYIGLTGFLLKAGQGLAKDGEILVKLTWDFFPETRLSKPKTGQDNVEA